MLSDKSVISGVDLRSWGRGLGAKVASPQWGVVQEYLVIQVQGKRSQALPSLSSLFGQ